MKEKKRKEEGSRNKEALLESEDDRPYEEIQLSLLQLPISEAGLEEDEIEEES